MTGESHVEQPPSPFVGLSRVAGASGIGCQVVPHQRLTGAITPLGELRGQKIVSVACPT
jgi:hypothetical protein